MKNLNIQTAAFELLEEKEPPVKISSRLQHLIDYYESGRMYYQKNISVEDAFDHDDTMAFLNSLHTLSVQMSAKVSPYKGDGRGAVCMILTRGDQQLNVMPISALFKNWTLEECLAIIQTVHSALVNYLHADNCVEFKTAFRTLSHWRSFFLELQTSDI